MQPRALIGLGALALALAVLVVLTRGPTAELARAPEPGRERAPTAQEPAARRPSGSPGDNLGDALQRVISPPREPQLRLPPAQARSEAEASFEHIMKTLEELADAGQRVPTARRDELYRNTNDAFAAFSAALDPNDAADMQALEDANIRMKAMLHELGVRVPRRPPVAEQ
jgi:hypothetical protein